MTWHWGSMMSMPLLKMYYRQRTCSLLTGCRFRRFVVPFSRTRQRTSFRLSNTLKRFASMMKEIKRERFEHNLPAIFAIYHFCLGFLYAMVLIRENVDFVGWRDSMAMLWKKLRRVTQSNSRWPKKSIPIALQEWRWYRQ